MTEKLFTGTLNKNQNKIKKQKLPDNVWLRQEAQSMFKFYMTAALRSYLNSTSKFCVELEFYGL